MNWRTILLVSKLALFVYFIQVSCAKTSRSSGPRSQLDNSCCKLCFYLQTDHWSHLTTSTCSVKDGKMPRDPATSKNMSTKYVIDFNKMKLLNQILKNITQNHWRPDDDYYGYNITLSDEIPVDRHVPDYRPEECKNVKYDYDKFPSVSIISPVHNEALTVLVRHVFAILLRTPNQLLKEIILVDDNSTFTYMGKDLEEFFKLLDPRIKIIRTKTREGCIRTRLIGAVAAESDVIVFLDGHMEVGSVWLEPLLERVMSQSAIVVQPDVPNINGSTFHHDTEGDVGFRGGFGWDMRYAWYFIPPYLHQSTSSVTAPIPTPVLVGNAFAVKKAYFNSIGQLDPGLNIWGGEHLDLSFRVWTSGGRVETVPCSKVGHVYKINKYSYGSQGKLDVLMKNLLRVAEVWMDEYKDFAYAAFRASANYIPEFTVEELRSIEERRELKRVLKCKDFTWFLKHVMPEVKIPSRDARWFGEVINMQTQACFYVTDDDYIGMTSSCYSYRILPENSFTIDKWGWMLYENMCIGYDIEYLYLKLVDCPCVSVNMPWPRWEIDEEGRLTYSGPWGKLCATHITAVTELHHGKQMVQALPCTPGNGYQIWHFMYKFVY